MGRVEDLRADYDRLGELLVKVEPGSGAAALVRERRIIGELLDRLEAPKEVPFVDEVGERRKAKSKTPRAPSRRRQSG